MKVFGLGARRRYPAKVTIDINTQCNASCVICPYPLIKDKIKHGVMDMGLYRGIIDDFAGICYRNGIMGEVSYCNMSEPTLIPAFPEYIRYARAKGCFTIYFNTNGSNLTPELVDTFVRERTYPAIHLNIMVFSKENYERTMGLGFEALKKNLRYLLDRYPHRLIDIGFFTRLMDRGEVEAAREFFKDTKVTLHLAEGVTDRAGNVSLPEVLTDFSSTPRKRSFGCAKNRPIHRMHINYDGRVYLCDQDMSLTTDFGNINYGTIEDIWNGAPMMEMLKIIYGEAAPGGRAVPCLTCQACVDGPEVKIFNEPGDYKPRRLLGPLKRLAVRKGWAVVKKRGRLGMR